MSNNYQQGLEALLQGGKMHRLPKGQPIQFSDNGMFIALLTSGFVKRYAITNDGGQDIQSIHGAGNILPLTPAYRALFDYALYTGPETFYYEAMTPVTMYTVTREEFERAIAVDPTLCRDVLFVSGVRLRSNIQRLENKALRNAHKQVAHQLLFYAEKFPSAQEGEITIAPPLTHQTLANVTSLARETVTHHLTRLQEKNIIRLDGGRQITILDMDALRKLVY